MTLTIRTKILAGYVVMLLAMAAVGVVALHGFTTVQRGYDAVRRAADRARASADVLTSTVDTETAVRGFLLTGEERFLEPLAPAGAARAKAVAAVRASATDVEEATQIERLDALVGELTAFHDGLVTRRRRGPLSDLVAALVRQKAMMDTLRGEIAAYGAQTEAAVAEQRASMLATGRRAFVLTGWLLAAAVLFGLGGGALAARAITRPLTALVAASRDLAAGRLDRRVALPGRDELGELARAFNAMAERIEASTSQLHATLKELQTPVIPIAEGLLALPIVGTIDTVRASQITEHLLAGVRRHHARDVIIDISAIHAVDSAVVKHLSDTMHAVRLMGARCTICGMTADVAQRLVALGITLGEIPTAQTMQDAIRGLAVQLVSGPRA